MTTRTGRPAGHGRLAADKHRSTSRPSRSPAPKRRRTPSSRARTLAPWLAVAAVVAVVAALVVAKAVSHPRAVGPTSTVPASVLRDVTTIPSTTFDAVGVPQGVGVPRRLPSSTPELRSAGMPRVLYVGAEYCPYCAAERWAMVVALSRFGTFDGLGRTESSTTDIFPGTKTFSFHGATYRSDYVSFTGVETETNRPASGGGYTRLDALSAADSRLLAGFDAPPYTTQAGAIPFTDIANRFVVIGAMFDPTVLQGRSLAEIARALRDPSSQISRSVLASANVLTAAVCEVTGGRPGAVCSSAAVTAASARLPRS